MLRLLVPLVLLTAASGCGSDGTASEPPPPEGDSADTAAETAYRTYTNERFGFSVEVPERFEAGPAPQNDDGRRFLSPDGAAEIAVSGSNDALGEGLDGARGRAEAGYDAVTSRADVAGGFALSGRRGDRLGYTKVVLRDGQLLTLDVEYPASESATYDDVAGRAARSFPGEAASGGVASAAPEAGGGPGWTAGVTELPGNGGPALVRSVRLGAHPDDSPAYDRVVFEVEGGTPGVHVEYVDSPVRMCGSGEAVRPEGDGHLEIRLGGARAYTEAGEPTVTHDRQTRGLPAIRETVPTCDFEGTVTWVLGVASPEPYRVLRLREPARVVVDVRHPARP